MTVGVGWDKLSYVSVIVTHSSFIKQTDVVTVIWPGLESSTNIVNIRTFRSRFIVTPISNFCKVDNDALYQSDQVSYS